jgi:large subunit ribosomal protein L29
MKNSEIRALSEAELAQKISSEVETLRKLKFAHAISPIENPNKIGQTRKLIARLKTALHQVELTSRT